MSTSIAMGTACVLLTIAAACGSGSATAAVPHATSHADAPGIDWFAGDVGAAFELAKSANKPVFLYWGAKWCPPCQQLKSSVFSRSDFISKSKQFIAVYLDGDDPGAQKWGDTYLNALLRLAPKDRARNRRVGLEVLGELDGPDRIQARTLRRLETLDEHLRQWNAAQHAAADIRVLHTRMSNVCAKLPSQDSGLASCRKFLQSTV